MDNKRISDNLVKSLKRSAVIFALSLFVGFFLLLSSTSVYADEYADQTASETEEESEVPATEETVVEKVFNVTYKLNGGTNASSNKTTYEASELPVTLGAPQKKGYIFKGWFTDSAYTKSVKKITAESAEKMTVYAKWQPVKYSITFNSNGGKGTMPKVGKIAYASAYTLPANKFVRNGFAFAGWNTKKNGTGTAYRNKAKVKSLTTKEGNTVILYAQWNPIYKVKFEANGGTANKNAKNVAKNTAYGKLPSAKKTGYTFTGWYTGKKSGKRITANSIFNTSKDQTLYAHWTANTYTVRLQYNDGTSDWFGGPVQYGQKYMLPMPGYRNGYYCTGYNTKANGKGKAYKPLVYFRNLTAKKDGVVKLYMMWKKCSASEIKYADKVISLVNKERKKKGLPALKKNNDLNGAAQQRANEITQYFSHERMDGTMCFSICSLMNGENIAMGQNTPEAVMKAWMNSTGHRQNILNKSFTKIGVGCFRYKGRLYWVQCFGY